MLLVSPEQADRHTSLIDRWSSHKEAAVQAQSGVAASSGSVDLVMAAPVKVESGAPPRVMMLLQPRRGGGMGLEQCLGLQW